MPPRIFPEKPLFKSKAEEKSRLIADKIYFKNKYYRKDIGFDL